MIEVKHLTKHYCSKVALNDVSFTVNDGEILGFLGPNGAGKSTTMNILTGYLSSTDGEVLINGTDILDEPIKAKKDIGYLPELPPLYPDMTVKEYLNFIYDLKKVKIPRKAHIEEVCSLVKITDVYERMIKHLSKGYRQRVGVAQALIGNPEILILDEPTVGLDPKQILDIRNLIKRLGKKHTVILSSHILSEIQAVCDRIVIINQGQIVADDTTEHLTSAALDDMRYTARIEGPAEDVAKLIEGIGGVVAVTDLGETEPGVHDFEIECEEDKDIRRDLFRRLCDRKWLLLGLKSNQMSLEDIFLRITMGDSFDFNKKKKPDPQADEELQKKLLEQISGAVVAADIIHGQKMTRTEETAAALPPESDEEDTAAGDEQNAEGSEE
ncbi:MAG: ATP-binding cassette domain-containing protein [Oscillospiraceae bacterium]|nr:ATP-binding cassette domain-containing protein [Oscillospiraceae bacterium]